MYLFEFSVTILNELSVTVLDHIFIWVYFYIVLPVYISTLFPKITVCRYGQKYIFFQNFLSSLLKMRKTKKQTYTHTYIFKKAEIKIKAKWLFLR